LEYWKESCKTFKPPRIRVEHRHGCMMKKKEGDGGEDIVVSIMRNNAFHGGVAPFFVKTAKTDYKRGGNRGLQEKKRRE